MSLDLIMHNLQEAETIATCLLGYVPVDIYLKLRTDLSGSLTIKTRNLESDLEFMTFYEIEDLLDLNLIIENIKKVI